MSNRSAFFSKSLNLGCCGTCWGGTTIASFPLSLGWKTTMYSPFIYLKYTTKQIERWPNRTRPAKSRMSAFISSGTSPYRNVSSILECLINSIMLFYLYNWFVNYFWGERKDSVDELIQEIRPLNKVKVPNQFRPAVKEKVTYRHTIEPRRIVWWKSNKYKYKTMTQ